MRSKLVKIKRSILVNFILTLSYAAILLHCLTNIITERIEVEQSDKRKHHYKVNLSTAVTNMRLWLRKIICTKEMIKRIKKYLAPVRPDRKYQRNMKPKSAIPFNTKASQRYTDYISYMSHRQIFLKCKNLPFRHALNTTFLTVT